MNHPSQNPPPRIPFNPDELRITQKATNRLAQLAPQSPVPAQHQPPLSVTEKRVLGLLVRGLTERQAAEELDRSPNTVHVHVRNIYRKLGVSSRKMLYRLIDARPELIADATDGEQGKAAA